MRSSRRGLHGLVIANPMAGGSSPEVIGEVIRTCARYLASVELLRTEFPGHAEEIAAKLGTRGGPDVVVAVGGDGTAHEVAAGLARLAGDVSTAGAPALLVIPMGTGNSFYREIWADRPWPEALDVGLAGGRSRVRRLDMARIAETRTPVLLGACSGLVADALVTAQGWCTELSGRDRYGRAVALTLEKFEPYPGKVTVDGTVIHSGPTVLANVGGGRHRGGRFQVLPRSVLDDGLLDVCVIGGALLAELPGVTLDGGHVGRAGVAYARGRCITVERTDGLPLSFEHDGEVLIGSATRYTLDVLPGVVPVLAPADAV